MAEAFKITGIIEARQDKLDSDLAQAEQKTKKAGEKIEGNLSLSGVAKGFIGVFAALSTMEAGLRSATGVAELFAGNTAAALDAFERIPLGIGPAIAAGRDFFEVVSGAREETERMRAVWSAMAQDINEAKSVAEQLRDVQNDADSRDPLRSTNQRSSELNRGIVARNRLIGELSEFESGELSGFRFGEELDGTVRLTEEWTERLKEAGIEANNTREAIEQLQRANTEAFERGVRAAREDRAGLRGQRESRVEELTNQRIREELAAVDQIELKRFETRLKYDQAMANAQTEREREAIEYLFNTRMALIEREAAAREAAEEELERKHIERLEEQRQRTLEAARRRDEAEAKIAEREAEQRERDRFVEGRGFSAEEFMRTNFSGGSQQPQEVKDPEAVGELKRVNENLVEIAARLIQQAATLS